MWFLCGLARVIIFLMRELEIKFPTHGVMHAFGFVYPQYWLQSDCDASFTNHLQVLKVVFCCGKIVCKVNEKEIQMQKLLNATNLDY
jgi:hypothetical protein